MSKHFRVPGQIAAKLLESEIRVSAVLQYAGGLRSCDYCYQAVTMFSGIRIAESADIAQPRWPALH